MRVKRETFYLAAFWFAVLFHIAHAVTLPILITVDGSGYLQMAEVLGTERFWSEWYFVRTPLYPAGLKFFAWLVGQQPLAPILFGTLLGFCGIWAMAGAVKRAGFPLAGALIFVVLTFNPFIVAYEHAVLTEIGSFFFLALGVNLLLWRPAPSREKLKTPLLVVLLIAAYYFRPQLLYLAPVFALLRVMEIWPVRPAGGGAAPARWTRKAFSRLALHGAAIALLPFAAAHPWQSYFEKSKDKYFINTQYLYCATKQALISPVDPVLGEFASEYEEIIRQSQRGGHLDWGGLRDGAHCGLWLRMMPSLGSQGREIFFRSIREHPERYVKGLIRTVMLYGGLPPYESENRCFRDQILGQTNARLIIDQKMAAQLGGYAKQTTSPSVIAKSLLKISPLYTIALCLGSLVLLVGGVAGLWRRDLRLLIFAVVPMAYLGMHALLLMGNDRMAFPVHPLLIASLFIIPCRLWNLREKRVLTPSGNTSEAHA
jgi:hypothetical protein